MRICIFNLVIHTCKQWNYLPLLLKKTTFLLPSFLHARARFFYIARKKQENINIPIREQRKKGREKNQPALKIGCCIASWVVSGSPQYSEQYQWTSAYSTIVPQRNEKTRKEFNIMCSPLLLYFQIMHLIIKFQKDRQNNAATDYIFCSICGPEMFWHNMVISL